MGKAKLLTQIVVFTLVLLAAFVAPHPTLETQDEKVSVEQVDDNTVIITNNADSTVNGSVESSLHTFNISVEPNSELVVPANTTEKVNIQ